MTFFVSLAAILLVLGAEAHGATLGARGLNLAVLGEHSAEAIQVVIKGATAGRQVRTLHFDPGFAPKALVQTGDLDRNGVAELAVLGVRAAPAAVQVEMRDADRDERIGSPIAFDATVVPLDLKVLSDFTDNALPELAVFYLEGDRVRALIKDAGSGEVAGAGSVTFAPIANFVALEVLNDLNGNRSQELAVLSVNGEMAQVDIRDADRDLPIGDGPITFTQSVMPLSFAALDDFNCNGAPELAVLSPQGIELRDALTGEPVGPGMIALPQGGEALMLRAIADTSGNEVPELAVLIKQGAMTHVDLRDAATGASVSIIPFGETTAPKLGILESLDPQGRPVTELAVWDEQADRQRVAVQIKEAVSGLPLGQDVISFEPASVPALFAAAEGLANVTVVAARQLVVQLLDDNDQPRPGANVLFFIDNEPEASGNDRRPLFTNERSELTEAVTVTTDVSGEAAALMQLGSKAGRVAVAAESQSTGRTIIHVNGVPDRTTARLVQVSGDVQVVGQGEELPEPLVVRLIDAYGNPFVGVQVTASVVEGDASFFRTETSCNAPLPTTTSTGMAVGAPRQTAPGTSNVAETDEEGFAEFRLFDLTPGLEDRVVIEISALDQTEAFTVFVRLTSPFGIDIQADGSMVVADFGLAAVVLVDPETGDRTLLSGADRGRGQQFVFPVGIAVEPAGTLAVVDALSAAIIRVDPATGNRTLISGFPSGFRAGQPGAERGEGPTFVFPRDIVVDETEDGYTLVVVDAAEEMVIRVHPETGDRTLISGDNNFTDVKRGEGPIVFPFGVAVEADGSVVVADPRLNAVFRADLATGDRTVVSGCRDVSCATIAGSGDNFGAPVGLTVVDDMIYVLDRANLALFRVNPSTGDRDLLLRNGRSDAELLLSVPLDLAYDRQSGLLVIANLGRTIVRVDPRTGVAFPVSSGANLEAPFFPTDVAIDNVTGDWIAIEAARGAVVRLNPFSGDCRIISGGDPFKGERVGSGPALIMPLGIGVDAENNIIVADTGAGLLLRVDAVSGDREVITPAFSTDDETQSLFLPFNIAADGQNNLVVTDLNRGAIQIDRNLQSRTLVPGTRVLLTGVAIDRQQRIVLLDSFNRAVLRFDPQTGELTTVSIFSPIEQVVIGRGLPFIFPIGLTIKPDGNYVVVDDFLDVVLQVDPGSGDRDLLSGLAMGIGPFFGRPLGVTIEPGDDGELVVADVFRESLIRINPETGNRVVFKCLQ